MARIRSIKPDYYQDEKIGALSRDARLLFPALWTHADDAGTFRANPALIRAQVFPYDDDVTASTVRALLQELAAADLVHMYEVNGDQYGRVKNFHKHQQINRPSKWRLPDPPEGSQPTHATLTEGSLTPHPRERERERERESTAPAEPVAVDKPVDNSAPPDDPPPDVPTPMEVTGLYNAALAPMGLPKAMDPSKQRASHIRARTRETLKTRQQWAEFFQAVAETPFLVGDNDNHWRANLGWLVKPENMRKVLEGHFSKGAPPPRRAPATPPAPQCRIDGCAGFEHGSTGLCSKHYLEKE